MCRGWDAELTRDEGRCLDPLKVSVQMRQEDEKEEVR